MSEANRVRLSYIEETTWGTTPDTPTFQTLRHTNQGLAHNIDTIVSQEVRSDRAQADTIQVNKYANGGFEFELSATSFDDLFTGALASTWADATSTAWAASTSKSSADLVIPTTPNGYYYECTTAGTTGASEPTWTTTYGSTVTDGTATWTCRGPVSRMINGTTKRFFSIEKALLDISKYFLFTGMVVNTMALNIRAGEVISGNFDFLGKIPDTASQATTFASSTTAATTTEVINAIGNVGTLYEGGSALSGIYLQEVSFSTNNNLRSLPAIGYDSAIDVTQGSFEVTGNISAYFANNSLYAKFLAGTESSLVIPMTKGSNEYLINFPRIKFESDKDSGGGLNTDVMEQLTFRALYSSTMGGQMAIHKL